MIIDFTATNFRSIKEPQTFSMYVEKVGNTLTENVAFPTNPKDIANNNIGVLKIAGIYGANASGKSNLFKALRALCYIVTDAGDLKDGELIDYYEPFLLSANTKHSPVKFEIEFFTHTSQRFIYSVAFSSHHIVQESLFLFTSSSKSKLFDRKEHDTWKDISFGNAYKGGKKQFALFSNNSYLSKAGNSADSPQIIREVYNYLRRGLLFISANDIPEAKNFIKHHQIIDQVALMIKNVDTGIEKIEFEDVEIDDKDDKYEFVKSLPEKVRKKFLEDQKTKIVFSHKTEEGALEKFSIDLESDGSRAMFNLFPAMIFVFNIGGVLVFDEIEKNLHPHIVELMIKLFNDPQVNTKNAQLLFTSHNVQLMSSDFLRRDQIWFIEKKNGASEFTCLTSFDKDTVRANSPFGSWYSEGRFGAIPVINYLKIAQELNKSILRDNNDA